MGFRWLVLFLVACPATVAFADVSPVSDDRIIATGGFGVGGTVAIEASSNSPTITVESGARAGGSAALQYDWAAKKYFVLAGRFGVSRYDWSADRTNMRTWLDFDVVPMLTFAIDAGPIVLEPRLGPAAGLTLNVWNQNDPHVIYNELIPRTNVGWNVGGFGGALIRASRGSEFVRRLGCVIELGYLHRVAYGNGDVSTHVQVRHGQVLVQLGVSISLR